VSLFRRQAQHVTREETGRLPDQGEIDALSEAFPVPVESAPFFADLSLANFIAVCLLKSFISKYKGSDGEGLFEGMERYRRLEQRASQSAVQAGNLRAFWGHLCRSLEVSGAVGAASEAMMRLLSIPATVGQKALATLAETPAPQVMMARFWDEQERAASKKYADSADMEQTSGETQALDFDADALTDDSGTLTVEVPQYSANSLRHELVREPAMWHLFHALEIDFDEPLGAMTSLFYNGGDLKSSGSASTFWKKKRIRTAYPSLGLLSGATDSFILGESNLRVHCWLRCRENGRALPEQVETDTSAFDLIDRETLTRGAGRLSGREPEDDNQMIYTFETLVPGAEIICRLSLTPYAAPLEEAALRTALRTFEEQDMTLGGQSARGYGKVELDRIATPEATGETTPEAYDEYLEEHEEDLRQGIIDGTLMSGAEVVSG